MRENGGAMERIARNPRAFLGALALSAFGALSVPAPARADNFTSIHLAVSVVDVIIPAFTISAPFTTSSQDFMTIPLTLDGRSFLINSMSVLYRSTAAPAGAPSVAGAPGASAAAAAPLTASDFSTFRSTGVVFSASPAGASYFKGAIMIPGSAYVGVGAVDYYFSVTLQNPSVFGSSQTFYMGAGGAVVADPVGLTPFSTVYVPRFEQPVTASGRTVVLDNDAPGTNAGVDLPAGALSGPADIAIEQQDPSRVPPRNGVAPASAYEFDGTVRRFNGPVTLTLRYPDLDAAPGTADGTNFNEKDLRVFWWDGFLWRLMGGTVDAARNTVSAKTTHFSLYALFPSAPAAVPGVFRPTEKVITPNGKTPLAHFSGLNGAYEINIYDVTGRRVRSIRGVPNPAWDGRDDGGRMVENGVYVYQYRADMSSDWVSGMIGVAK